MLITILFTANLRADFSLLPYVATTIRQARLQESSAMPRPTLLVDLGGMAAADSWVCQATENRAPYLVLDAMGYTVARADGLDVGGILGLREVVQVFLMDDSIVYKWRSQGIEVQVGSLAKTAHLAPAIAWYPPSPATNTLYEQGEGRIILNHLDGFLGKIEAEYPSMQVQSAVRIPFVIHNQRPDPSILEMIKFVESEARAYQHRKGE